MLHKLKVRNRIKNKDKFLNKFQFEDKNRFEMYNSLNERVFNRDKAHVHIRGKEGGKNLFNSIMKKINDQKTESDDPF